MYKLYIQIGFLCLFLNIPTVQGKEFYRNATSGHPFFSSKEKKDKLNKKKPHTNSPEGTRVQDTEGHYFYMVCIKYPDSPKYKNWDFHCVILNKLTLCV